MTTKLKISKIRDIIRSVQWTRNDLTGGTSEEFRKQQVGPSLRAKIVALQALDIPSHFVDDIEMRATEIQRCEAVIARWEAAQTPTAPVVDNRTCVEGGPRHVFLGTPFCQLCRHTKGDEVARYVTGDALEFRTVVITRSHSDYIVSHWETVDREHGKADARAFDTVTTALLHAMAHVQGDVADLAKRMTP